MDIVLLTTMVLFFAVYWVLPAKRLFMRDADNPDRRVCSHCGQVQAAQVHGDIVYWADCTPIIEPICKCHSYADG
jgi:hypothetical protein